MFGNYNLQTVTAISEQGNFVLSNGAVYSRNQVQALVPSLDGISVGDRVLKTVGTYAIFTVTAISEQGQFMLSNGAFYTRAEIQLQICESCHSL